MGEAPTVATIVPNFNHALYLPQRMDTVFEQSKRAERVIILDDCSTDNSREIIDGYRDRENTQILYGESNTGDPFSQWNKGIALASEDYIWIAESDDFAELDFLEKMLETAMRFPSAGIIYCQSDLVDETGEVSGDLDTHYADLDSIGRWESDFFNNGWDECLSYLVFKNTIPNASACLFRRDVFERIGLASTGFRLCGDWMTYIRLLEVSDIAFSADILNHYRRHDNTARNSSEKAVLETLETYKVLNYMKQVFGLEECLIQDVSARVFERFHYLLSQCGGRNLPVWGEIEAEALQFDERFTSRLSFPFCSMRETAVLYFGGKGNFTEGKTKSKRFPSGDCCKLHFEDCIGEIRFDPCARAGRIEIFNVCVIDSSGKSNLWECNASTGFEGMRIGGTSIRLEEVDKFILYSYGDDPQLFFPVLPDSQALSLNETFDVEVTLKVYSI
jgi:glycosyltransferase involved in cell wall biosynthesis